jgi:hypothetical protein
MGNQEELINDGWYSRVWLEGIKRPHVVQICSILDLAPQKITYFYFATGHWPGFIFAYAGTARYRS